MDSVTNDPELAQEMARLLYMKLERARRVRDELRASGQYSSEGLLVDSSALQSENERLRDKLAEMRNQLSVTPKWDNKPIMALTGNYGQASDTMEDIAHSTSGAEEAQAAKIRGLAQKAHAYKLKYKEVKTQGRELLEKQSQLEQQLDMRRADLDLMHRHLRDVQSELERAQTLFEDSFDLSTFLSTVVKVPGCPDAHSLHPLTQSTVSIIKCPSTNAVVVLSREVVWHANLNRALVLVPAMHYDPTKRAGKGSWQQTQFRQSFCVDGPKHVEVVFQDGSDRYYYGTYKTVHISTIPVDNAKKLSHAVTQHGRDSIILHRDQVAPAICKFVDALFMAGGLQFACFAIERVGFSTTDR